MKTISKKELNFLIDSVEKIPGWLKIIGCLGQSCEDYAYQYADRKEKVLSDEKKYYYDVEIPKVRKLIKEFREKNKEFEMKCIQRMREEKKKEIQEKILKLEKMTEKFGNLEEKKKLLQEIEREEKMLNSRITQGMIERAREYPIEQIIQSEKYWAICPFHEDTKPSFFLKNNYGHCFSCGATVDTIDLYKKINNCSFKEAVLALQ